MTTGPVELSRRQVLRVFAGLMTAMLLAALDQTIVATALPTIVGEFGGLSQLSWVVTWSPLRRGFDDVLTTGQMIDLVAERLGRRHSVKIHVP